MPRIRICKEKGCHNSQTSGGFCRLHYLKNWKKVQAEKKKKAAKNLNRYIESVMKRNPERYVEDIKKEIRSRDFGERVGKTFGAGGEEEDWSLFDAGTSDEDLKDILEQIKVDKDY